MSTEKDKIIDELFGVIQKKKEEIKKVLKPEWNTNCSYVPIFRTNQQLNLKVIANVDEIVNHVTGLMYRMDYISKAAAVLEVKPNYEWQGFLISDWIADFKTRVAIINVAKKKKELESLSKRLDKLVSPTRREELELEAIRKELSSD